MQWADECMFPHVYKEQKTRHLAIKKGDVCNRIITMGSATRAIEIAKLLHSHKVTIETEGFLIITGAYNNVPVTILCCGIGFPNIDIMVREARSVVDGPMLIIRLGSAGTSHNEVNVGNLVVASKGSYYAQRNPDAFSEINSKNHYSIFDTVDSDQRLSRQILENITKESNDSFTPVIVHEGMNASTDFFYGSQGRNDSNFLDYNDQLLENMYHRYPDTKSIEMETFQLLGLARHCKQSIKASAVVLIRSHRLKTGNNISNDEISRIEKLCGTAVLKAITSYTISENES